MQDFSAVPATPVYSLMISNTGGDGLVLTIDGEHIADGASLEELRTVGRDQLTVRAALAGCPVRARAVDPETYTPWLMIITPDGAIYDVPSHPAPPPPAAPPRPVPAAPAGPPATLVPEAYREAWTALWAAHAAGDLATAVLLAYRLERDLEAAHGPRHPYTITVLTARAWLTLCRRVDPAATCELLITTALRRHAAGTQPEADTLRAARNAHALWAALTGSDPEAAAALAGPLADMLAALGETGLGEHVRTRSSALTVSA
ncbi:hypothetical protein [Streptomyces sp. NPDC059708]|uniref:hypothetical protein n=1 Tax=Streptomyces sp. NPDC059708 TaxID=3346916 RepID=UPI0036CCC708